VQEEAPETVAPLILDFLTTLPPAPAAGDMKASP
jgi:hypothetical protein